ncbi:hypothetical protein KCP70_13440 [Salmonella enterica subsp. enterica]|nr:hypothetical protein KCP70_13440 [Salmonella enterica subsp. enterica]
MRSLPARSLFSIPARDLKYPVKSRSYCTSLTLIRSAYRRMGRPGGHSIGFTCVCASRRRDPVDL